MNRIELKVFYENYCGHRMECTQIGSHDVGAANRFWRVEMLLNLVLFGFMYVKWGY